MKKDFHGYRKRLESAIEKVQSSKEISGRNKKLILDYLTHCQVEALSIGRIARLAYCMIKLSEWLKKDFDTTDKSDIERLVGIVQNNDKYKDWTKHLYKVAIKKFYKWMNGGEEYPKEVRWIKCNFKNSDKLLPEELLTKDEVMKIVEVAEHPRDKAFISAIYESGCRIGEIGLLSIKHLAFDEYGAQMIVDGKTGMRRVRLIASVPYLSSWLNIHPFKNNPEAALWVSIGTVHHDGPMAYRSLVSLLKKTAKKAGIRKKVNPQRWRKSRATHVAPHMKELLMDEYFGWVLGSDMPKTYVHLSGKDIDDSLLQMYGMKKNEEKSDEPMKPKVCEICQHVNDATSKFCNKCARPLDINALLELEKKRMKDEDIVVKMLETPGMLEHFVANTDENNIKQLMQTHPNLTPRISAIVMKNLRR